MTNRYELVWSGSTTPEYKFPRYRRFHPSVESAQRTVYQVAEKLDRIFHPTGGTVLAAHNPILHGPGCGDSGKPLRVHP